MLAETCCAGAGLGSKNALTTENDGPSGGNSGGGRNGKPVLLPGKSATGDRSDSARTPSNRRLVLRDRVRPLHLIHEGALRLFCPSLDSACSAHLVAFRVRRFKATRKQALPGMLSTAGHCDQSTLAICSNSFCHGTPDGGWKTAG